MKRLLVACVSLAAMATVSGTAQSAIIYQSDFSTGLSGFTTTGSGTLRTRNGTSYIGGLTLGSAGSVTVNTAGYTNLTLSFDLYAVLSLDGNGPAGGGVDPFNVTQDSNTIFNYTFANYSGAGNTQSYPAANSAPQSGAYTTNLLGYGSGDFGDSEYRIAPISLTSVNGNTVLSFIGNSNQDESDEFYGINNVVLSGDAVTSSVPEPATWAMMIGGIGMAGGALRRGRKTLVRASYAV